MRPANRDAPLVPYIRQSRAKEKTISLADQWDAIKTWADRTKVKLLVSSLDATKAAGLVEQNVSGAKDWRKREIGTAISMVQEGKASGIIVAFQDRLARPTWLQEAEVWEALGDGDGRLVCAAEGTDFRPGDPDASDARLLYRMKAAVARHNWERHCRNWRKGKHAAWEAGVYVSPPPAGYDRIGGLIPNEHAEAVKRAFQLRVEGAGWSEIVRTLQGAPTRGGNTTWSKGGARLLLQNEVYTGKHTCTCGCGESAIREEWQIVKPWLYRKAQAKTVKRHYVRGEGHILGNGLVRCPVCDVGLVRSTAAGGRYVNLRCPSSGGGHPSIRFDVVADYLISLAFSHVGPMLRQKPGSDEQRERLREAVEEVRAEFERAEELLGITPPPDSKPALALVDAEAALDEFEAQAGAPLGLADFLTPVGVRQEFFEKQPIPEQRRMLRRIVKRATLKPGRGHVGERLEVEFVDGSTWPAPIPEQVPGRGVRGGMT